MVVADGDGGILGGCCARYWLALASACLAGASIGAASALTGEEIAHMPKMKTHKGSVKRFSVTGTGKYRFRKSWQNHRMRKSEQNLRMLGKMQTVPKSDVGHLRQALPYV